MNNNTVEDVIVKTDTLVLEKAAAEEMTKEKPQEEKEKEGKHSGSEVPKEDVAVEIEPKTGVSFPVKLDDGKQLCCVGLRKKTLLGLGIKIYGFGIYVDHEKLKDLLKSKIGQAPAKATKEMYQLVIDSDVEKTLRMIIVFSRLTMSMVRNNISEALGTAIKKLTGGNNNEELVNKVMGLASDNIKLPPGSIIEISLLPGYVLQTKVKDEVLSQVDSELICRAYMWMYLGDDAFDKDAKEKFGMSMLSLF